MNENGLVKDIMTKDVVTVDVNDRFVKIEEVFDLHDFHHIIVLDAGQVVGVISKQDLLKKYRDIRNDQLNADITLASHVMSNNPLAVDPDDNIGLVADIILANKFHALPVVEDGVLMGIVTSHDLIKYGFER